MMLDLFLEFVLPALGILSFFLLLYVFGTLLRETAEERAERATRATREQVARLKELVENLHEELKILRRYHWEETITRGRRDEDIVSGYIGRVGDVMKSVEDLNLDIGTLAARIEALEELEERVKKIEQAHEVGVILPDGRVEKLEELNIKEKLEPTCSNG